MNSFTRVLKSINSHKFSLAEKDKFIQGYLDISTKAFNSPFKQNIQLGIYRNDFMIDKTKKFIYQIEINTIASSLGYFSDQVKKFYSYFSKKYPEFYEKYLPSESNSANSVPTNRENVIDNIAEGMINAIKLFSPDNYINTLIVFVVQESERNEFDQRAIENLVWEK